MDTTLLVVVPALNEEESIGRVVGDIRRCGERLAELGCDSPHICVVDDGSSDRTAEVARDAGVDHVLVHKGNQGLGAAVRSGLVYGRERDFAIAVKLDADGQHDPADIAALIAPILADRADIVYGDRYPRMTYAMPLVRRMANAVFRSLMRWLTPWDIRDSQPGMFAVSDAYLKVFFISGDYNYTQQILIDSYHKGMRFEQVPITFRRRERGRSFISFRYPFKVLSQILMTLVSVKPLRVFMPLAGLFLAAAGGLFGIELVVWLLGEAERPVEHVNLVLGLSISGLNIACFGLLAELVVRRG